MKVKNAVVGAKVMIKKSSGFYMGTPSNPINSVGEVIGGSTGLDIRVRWGGGHINSYRYEDLKLVKE